MVPRLTCSFPTLWLLTQHPQCPLSLFSIHGNCFVLCYLRAFAPSMTSALNALTSDPHLEVFSELYFLREPFPQPLQASQTRSGPSVWYTFKIFCG